MLTVDVTDFPDVSYGSPVELWGEQLPVDDVATACGTIGYELLCAIAPRVTVEVMINLPNSTFSDLNESC